MVSSRVKTAFRDRYGARMWMTGSTGIAALSIEEATILSQSGLHRGKGLASRLLGRMSHACKKRWQQVPCIVIDEISMTSAHFP